ncbi:MAG: DUF4139 domain-containing protein [Firmicutes bacterium]|nr:DUF4139 domain-containing protein [Bacillota bacterium]
MKLNRVPFKNKFLGLVALLLLVLTVGNSGLFASEQKQLGGKVELTVYNQDLALVKERRILELPLGLGELRFTDVAASIDPTSVWFRSLTDPKVKVLEQNYEYDVISDLKLLQKYLGEKIRLVTVKGDNYEGYLVSTGANIIIASKPQGGEVKVIKSGQIQGIFFPEMPGGLVVRPTLVWLLSNPNQIRKQQVEVSYLTGGLSWKADYVATVNQTDDRLDLIGWVTLNNKSGIEYQQAKLKLVAGDVNRAPEEMYPKEKVFSYSLAGEVADTGFAEESFFEYHLYTLGRSTTIKNNQVKQVELLTSTSVPVKKLFIYEGAINPNKVKVMLELKNSKENNMGMPLPKGRIRVQKADGEGSLQFIGEDRIDHTPKDEKVRIHMGNAFDIKGERIRTEVRASSKNTREESYRITLRNHKNEPVTITAIEYLNRWSEWQIIKKDCDFVKTEDGKAEFAVTIPADGEKVINYTVRYKY